MGVQSCIDHGSGDGPELTTLPVPPSAIVPRSTSEPIRGDIHTPNHVRGSGYDWPPEARIDPKRGAGRWPLAYAWPSLYDGHHWTWQHAGDGDRQESTSVSAADAIIGVLGSSIAYHTKNQRHRPPTCLVIPNDLTQDSQQRLLNAARAMGIDLRLVWRPVAAALAWCEQSGPSLIESSKSKLDTAKSGDVVLGELLTLYLGVDAFEATPLSIVARRHKDQWVLLPARDRPAPRSTIRHWVTIRFECFIREAARSVGKDLSISELWQWMWAGSWPAGFLSSLRHPSRESVNDQRIVEAWRRSERAYESAFQSLHRSKVSASVSQCIADISKQHRDLCGIVATGPLAGVKENGSCLAEQYTADFRCAADRILIEDQTTRFGTLALGAGDLTSRIRSGIPAYLDTLPRIRIAALRLGEPAWIELLDQKDQWVEGGKTWQRIPNLPGVEIPRGSDTLKVALNHEEFESVRNVTAHLPHQVSRNTSVSLAVTMEPAQGNARVEVVPAESKLFGRSRVYVEWDRMKDTGCTPEDYLLYHVPRILPPLHPRLASRERWNAARWWVSSAVTSIREGRAPNVDVLKKLNHELRNRESNFRDRKTGSLEASAFSDSGVNHLGDVPGDLAALIEFLVAQLPAGRPRTTHDKYVVRVLGYTATDDERLLAYLRDVVETQGPKMGDAIANACGWCFRDESDIAQFATSIYAAFQVERDIKQYFIRAFAQMLRFRASATRQIESELAIQLVYAFQCIFEEERRSRNGNYRFRESCRSIGYLLRRRAYDNNFLAPDSELAIQVKKECQQAVRDYESDILKLVKGTADLSKELNQVIEYIDRHGTGLLGIE